MTYSDNSCPLRVVPKQYPSYAAATLELAPYAR